MASKEKLAIPLLAAVDPAARGRQHRAPHRRAFVRVVVGLALWFLFKLFVTTQKDLGSNGVSSSKQREDLFLYVPN